MLKQLRENIYIGDKDAWENLEELKKLEIKSVIVVADNLPLSQNVTSQEPRIFKMGLRLDRKNPPYIKDLICHTALQMVNNGETILIQSNTGLERAAFVACRIICEIEKRTIYEIMQELKADVPEFDIGKSYF